MANQISDDLTNEPGSFSSSPGRGSEQTTGKTQQPTITFPLAEWQSLLTSLQAMQHHAEDERERFLLESFTGKSTYFRIYAAEHSEIMNGSAGAYAEICSRLSALERQSATLSDAPASSDD
jgi:hypothetical protein